MGRAKRRRSRRLRRKERLKWAHGQDAAPKHRLRSGRTGSAHGKKLAGVIAEAKKAKRRERSADHVG